MASTNKLEAVKDERLPASSALTVPGIPEPVAAVYGRANSQIQDCVPVQASWRPGKSLTVRYRVLATGGGLAGERQVVAVAGEIPDGALVVEGPDGAVGAWAVPYDPVLNGMPSALDRPTVAALLARLGAGDEVRSLRLRAYRPGRRAVVQVDGRDAAIYLKVVRQTDVEGLHEKHRFLAQRLPVPDSMGFSRDLGILVMPALPGTGLRDALRSNSDDLPPPAAIAGMIEQLPEPPDDARSYSPLDLVGQTRSLLGSLIPHLTERLEDLAGRIGSDSDSHRVPVHGDFYEAQILIQGSRPSGLLDVDTYGWGRRGDDPATMLGHLQLLAPSCADPGAVLDYALSLQRLWDRRIDPIDLRKRVAAVMLGLATGPFRVLLDDWRERTLQRIEIADQWLSSADGLDEKSLMDPS